jgi:hypothetical protein
MKVNKSDCATRKHIELGGSAGRAKSSATVTVAMIVRTQRLGFAVWAGAALALSLLVDWKAGMFVLGLFTLFYILGFSFRKFRGHTVRCSLLAALSGTLQLPDFIS